MAVPGLRRWKRKFRARRMNQPAKVTVKVRPLPSVLSTTTADGGSVDEVTIDTLPDDALLQIFLLCRQVESDSRRLWWKSLVHVCRRWRLLIFASPRSLRLAVVCLPRSPVKKSLHVWPPFPISIRHDPWDSEWENENTISALELRDRVSEISISSPERSVLARLTAAMLKPFPALASLYLGYGGHVPPVLPETLLGGYVPSLRTIVLYSITFPALPALLLSAPHLTSIRLWKIPITGYISPVTMAVCLAELPHLEDLRIEFRPGMNGNDMGSSFLTRSTLPSLTTFHFKGVCEYLENLIARIDAPILQTLSITFCAIVLRIPQLYRFLSCAERPDPPRQVVVEFDYWRVELKFIPSYNFELAIKYDNVAGQVSSMAAVCHELGPLLSRVERLDLHGKRLPPYPVWQDDTAPTGVQWLALFCPFTTVESLYISKKLESLVAPALEEITRERPGAVFPKLRTLFLEELQPSGPVREAIEAFVATRWLSDRPVTFRQRLHLDSDAGDALSPCSWPAWYWQPD